jgi:hypothetical protein
LLQVSAALLYVGRFYARGETGKVLASCLDCIYSDLPATVLRVQAEDLLNLAELCLEDVSSNMQLNATLFRCILISMRHCNFHDERILRLWSLAHAPEMHRDVLGPFQIALVACLSEAIRLARLSVGEEGITEAYSVIPVNGESICDETRQKSGKRPRSIFEHHDSSTTSCSANKRHLHSEHNISIMSEKSEVDGRRSQLGSTGGWKLELAVVQAGIRSSAVAMDDLRRDQPSMAKNGFRQLQSALMVLNLSSCPSAWRHLLVRS